MCSTSDFIELSKFISEINSSNSTNHKIDVLNNWKKSQFIQKILYYTYNPYFNFGVTSKNLKKKKDLVLDKSNYSNLFDLLDDLNNRVITGHSAIREVNTFILNYPNWEDLIYQVIDRNLKTRATTTLINKVIPNLIPTFSVALAHDINKIKSLNLFDASYYISRKLDGIRCIIIVNNGEINFYSRNGKPFTTLDTIKDEIVRLGIKNIVLDGEICLMNKDESDDFQGILKEIQRKDHTIKNPKFWIFDILTLDEFNLKTISPNLIDRLTYRSSLLGDIDTSKIFSILNQDQLRSSDQLNYYKEVSLDNNWEGLMIRRNIPYENGRTDNLLKVKLHTDNEYRVVDLIMATQRIIIDGIEKEEEMLSAVIIKHKGDPVKVGSGFTIAERQYYYQNPDKILGMTILVQCFEETIDHTGKSSLRFPVFKINYGESRDI